jgi:hypothetical protein
MSAVYLESGDGIGSKTAAADTAIVTYAKAKNGRYTHVLKFASTQLGTAHTATLMRDASSTYLTASAAASQAVINVAAALTDGGGNAIAAGDYVAVQLSNGNWHVATFSSAATLAYTLGTNLPSAAASGAKVFCYGVIGDAFHDDYDFVLTASAQVVIPSGDVTGTVVRGRSVGAPVLYYDGNATAAGVLNYLMWGYSKK